MQALQDEKLDAAREAKEKARTIFSRHGTVNGIGLTRMGERYAVKVNFESEPHDRAGMPIEIGGVPVVVQVVGTLHKQAIR
jgi:hypothetical protein